MTYGAPFGIAISRLIPSTVPDIPQRARGVSCGCYVKGGLNLVTRAMMVG